MSESMAKIRQIKLFYRIMKYRMGVGRVSAGCRKGVELWSKLRQKCTIVARFRQNVDTCDTLAIPLRRGGCRSYSSIIPMVIASFYQFAIPFRIFKKFSARKKIYPCRCRKLNCVKNVATGLIKTHVIKTNYA